MDFIPSGDFNVLHPMLLDGVAQCEGYDWLAWITKCIILTNELEVNVARDICHSISVDLVIDNNDMPLDNDCVAFQIAKSQLEEEISSEWMFSMRAWYICRVFLNGASLYDHDQRHIYNVVVHALNCQAKKGV
jgi:hypothetical protein